MLVLSACLLIIQTDNDPGGHGISYLVGEEGLGMAWKDLVPASRYSEKLAIASLVVWESKR